MFRAGPRCEGSVSPKRHGCALSSAVESGGCHPRLCICRPSGALRMTARLSCWLGCAGGKGVARTMDGPSPRPSPGGEGDGTATAHGSSRSRVPQVCGRPPGLGPVAPILRGLSGGSCANGSGCLCRSPYGVTFTLSSILALGRANAGNGGVFPLFVAREMGGSGGLCSPDGCGQSPLSSQSVTRPGPTTSGTHTMRPAAPLEHLPSQ